MVLPAALIAAVLVIAVFRAAGTSPRIGILKWGKVATVTNNDTLSKGTYYSGMTYNNMRKRQASGWDADDGLVQRPGLQEPGRLHRRRRRRDATCSAACSTPQGVILADPRKKDRALCVSQFPYSVKPGPDGQLTGELTAWLWGGIIATLVIEADAGLPRR